ncbi:MAG TPA: hemerythrin domain-containing protein [Longimicrobium sp.]|nr:hemerythrin domain-containing protein [Longimicrobium sp.]
MFIRAWTVAALGAAALAGTAAPRPVPGGRAPVLADTTFPVPSSIQDEHLELLARVVAATEERGPVGEAARELSAVLSPHFAREEKIALPPLGLLAALGAGELPAGADDVLPLTDSLRVEWPRMMEEHRRIAAALDQLDAVARAEGHSLKYDPLVQLLRRHARMEEEVLYPAALLAGEVVRARRLAFRRR